MQEALSLRPPFPFFIMFRFCSRVPEYGDYVGRANAKSIRIFPCLFFPLSRILLSSVVFFVERRNRERHNLIDKTLGLAREGCSSPPVLAGGLKRSSGIGSCFGRLEISEGGRNATQRGRRGRKSWAGIHSAGRVWKNKIVEKEGQKYI